MPGLEVDAEIVARLSAVCLGFPDVVEQDAWRGTRWRIRGRTFAHVLPLTEGSPPSYAKATGLVGPVTLLTFQITAVERELFGQLGLPYWAVRWGRDVGGLVLSEASDWTEIAELVTDSYRLLAPQKLVARLDFDG